MLAHDGAALFLESCRDLIEQVRRPLIAQKIVGPSNTVEERDWHSSSQDCMSRIAEQALRNRRQVCSEPFRRPRDAARLRLVRFVRRWLLRWRFGRRSRGRPAAFKQHTCKDDAHTYVVPDPHMTNDKIVA